MTDYNYVYSCRCFDYVYILYSYALIPNRISMQNCPAPIVRVIGCSLGLTTAQVLVLLCLGITQLFIFAYIYTVFKFITILTIYTIYYILLYTIALYTLHDHLLYLLQYVYYSKCCVTVYISNKLSKVHHT